MPYRVTASDPFVTLDVQALERRIATFCKSQGITTDAELTTFLTTRFNATNASGLTTGTRSFLIELLAALVTISTSTA